MSAVDDDLLTELGLLLYLELGHIVVLFAGALLKAMAVGTGKYFGSENKSLFWIVSYLALGMVVVLQLLVP